MTATHPTRNRLRPNLQAAILTATENIAYWTRRKVTAARPCDRAAAGARVILWQQELTAKSAKLQAINAVRN